MVTAIVVIGLAASLVALIGAIVQQQRAATRYRRLARETLDRNRRLAPRLESRPSPRRVVPLVRADGPDSLPFAEDAEEANASADGPDVGSTSAGDATDDPPQPGRPGRGRAA